jgi:hypothetical protein
MAQKPDLDQVHLVLVHLALRENHHPILINFMLMIAIIE